MNPSTILVGLALIGRYGPGGQKPRSRPGRPAVAAAAPAVPASTVATATKKSEAACNNKGLTARRGRWPFAMVGLPGPFPFRFS